MAQPKRRWSKARTGSNKVNVVAISQGSAVTLASIASLNDLLKLKFTMLKS